MSILPSAFYRYSILRDAAKTTRHFAGLALLLTLSPVVALAGENERSDPASQVESLTIQMASMARGEGSDRVQEADLLALAERRRQLLAQMIEHHPGTVGRYALPERYRERLPEAVAAMLEQSVSATGDLEVVYRDADNGSAQLHYYLNASGHRYQLFLAQAKPGLRSGMTVRAQGMSVNRKIAIATEEELQVLAYGGESDGESATLESGLAGTLGAQHVAVLMVNFTLQPDVPWTRQEVHDAVFVQANDFIRENAYGKAWLEGDVLGWFTLDVDPAGCPSGDIAVAAKQSAAEAGYDLSGYDRIVFAFPDIGCSYSGEATVGGAPSYAWLDGTVTNAGVVSHELGHNLGLYHAHALDCGVDVINENCTVYEYGDVLDRMGDASAGHFNAFQKARLGWIGESQEASLLTPAAGGSYAIGSLSDPLSGAKAIRVPRAVDPVTGHTQWLYIEYRDGSGADDFLAGSRYAPTVANGVVVHFGDDGNGNSSSLLDMTPNSQKYDMDDLALAFGNAFTDPVSGTTVAVEQVVSGQAEITVHFGDTTEACVEKAPSMEVVSASSSAWASAGTPVSFSMQVSNQDGTGCAQSLFNLSADVETGWAASFDTAQLQLAPGESAVVNVTVTSSASATAGFYEVPVNATHQSGHQAQAVVTYVVEDLEAPTQPQGLTLKEGKRKVDLAWSASTDNVAVTGYRVWKNHVLVADVSTTEFSDFDHQKGTVAEYWVEAYDAAGNISTASLSLSTGTSGDETTSPGGKGGGNGGGKKK